ncbi:uncharacterized protein LOC116175728 isoform X1 [Photinus pyralis]|nr:uncharacterized protein LOC116175728 isoform X1 [Photinus pyralis]XP_031349854.1 uncharacterized protein LOC116175728 isoform X1 [Photinus pyralis]
MGAKQSRRSVDITTTPKKGEIESPIEGEGKVEKISDLETKIATNGSIHNEIEYADKEETEKEDAEAAIKENGVSDSEGSKTPDADVFTGNQLNESSDVAEKSADSLEKSDETNENNKKNKEKSKKKKWSFRALSFSKKDKSKPGKDEKNGDVKEVNEEGAEETITTPTSPEETKANEVVSPSLPESEVEPLTNGEADIAKPTTEVTKDNENVESKPVEQPTSVAPKVSETKPIASPVLKEEETKVEELKAEGAVESIQPKQEESTDVKADETVVAEPKEVRNEEVPPPLPSSNPPSPVTVFAESTMADSPPTDHVPIAQSTIPAVESAIAPISSVAHPDDTPEILPAPSTTADMENISSKGDCPEPVEVPTSESIISTPPIVEQSLSEPPQTDPIIETPPASVPHPIIKPPSEAVTELPNVPVQEVIAEPAPALLLDSSIPEHEVEQSSPNKEPEPLPLPTPIEQVINTDSLPDISTESLPSLPEPLSESLPEPMSLPPVDCIPEPIAPQANSLTEPEPIPNIPIEQDSIADIPLPNSEAILTNGDAHGPPSPVVDDTSLTAIHEGPVKQVIATSEVSEVTDEKRHDTNEVEVSSVPTTVEE